MGHRILSQYGESVGSNQIRNTVMDFRVYMVRPAGQNNTALTMLF